MAAQSPNGDGSAPVDGELHIKPPPEITIPPKIILETIHKTTDWLYRRDANVEDQLRERSLADGTTKLSFLHANDPYNKYYAWYLQLLRDGKGPRSGGAQLAERPKGPPKPPDFVFCARMPNISAKDLDILKVTALYAARNGENWLKDLRNREAGNFQFDFLRPNHSFHQYFRGLIDQFRLLTNQDQRALQLRTLELRRNVEDRFNVLDKSKSRAQFMKYKAAQKEKEEKKVEDEKKEYASIDWHDFSVIATVTFDEGDDTVDLPPPISLNDLLSRSLEDKEKVSISRRIEEAAPDDDTYYNVTQQAAPSVQPPMPYSMPIPTGMPYAMVPPPGAFPNQPAYHPSPPPAVAHAYPPPVQGAHEDDEARARAAQAQPNTRGAPGPMRIRNDYVPRAKKPNVPMAICPNCKQQFPANELDDHMRIELLDPRWKEMREKADARYSSTVSTVDVANNLKRFASMRDDIYDGATGLPITEEEQARRKKAALNYDGQPDPAKDAVRMQEMQTMNLQDQLRRINEKHGRK
ncbi:hypothetical protein EJ04DRAFT_453765 [Polyplosphaeria fusca]|uniref:SURP motif domain-containing protein n=1 Tax=Polyplosphaeria fusca TaxID=682080 RepID=A0A9P4RC23_9PLEO|nr:hypothetical protein EJ04DRAFT_453765 [Polyplosphaeria fusca]